MENKGKKHDDGKLRYDLVQFDILDEVVDILNFGAEKYGENNWKRVKDGRRRYFAATLRHLSLWRQGETWDKESGANHLAHAVCSAAMCLWHDNRYQRKVISDAERQEKCRKSLRFIPQANGLLHQGKKGVRRNIC